MMKSLMCNFTIMVIFSILIFPKELSTNFSRPATIDPNIELFKKNSKVICTNFSKSQESQAFCFEAVKKQNWLKNESNMYPKLVCVQNHSAVISWTNDKTNKKLAIQISSKANQSITIYLITNSHEKYVNFSGLNPATEYRVLILRWNFSFLEEIFPKDVAELNFTTLPDNMPLPNILLNVTKIYPINGTHINALMKWNSSNEIMPCLYQIYWYKKLNEEGPGLVNEKSCDIPKTQECIIPNLKHGSTYGIWLNAKNDLNSLFSDTVSLISYDVPVCRQSAEKETWICETLPRVNIIDLHDNNCTDYSNCRVTISWKSAVFEPDYYNIAVETVRKRDWSRTFYDARNVTNVNSFTINLPRNETYRITVTVHKNGLSSQPTFKQFFIDPASKKGEYYEHNFISASIFSIVVLFFLIILLFLYGKRKRNNAMNIKKLKKWYDKILITNMEIIPPNPEMKAKFKEPQKYQLSVGKILGMGNFGIVFQGTLISNGRKVMDVAVKTLRDNATAKDIKQFEKEISLMEDVGFHNNIVSMIGSCLSAKRPLLIVEYCPLGDLHAYLRNIKKTRANFSDYHPVLDNPYQNSIPIGNEDNSKFFVHNKIYEVSKDVVVPQLSICDLLSFGRQVAIGMEYLTSNYVIHRDLAARNILLCNDKTVKISDFGLSRDIYAENIYRKPEGGEIMPIKWMALESICNREYSTFSDVWSFGIFLWELFTMGDEPYPDITVVEILVLQLREGYRMQNPCPSYPQIYEIMLNCWHEQPELRPQFSTLRDLLDQILRQCSPNQYITITGNED